MDYDELEKLIKSDKTSDKTSSEEYFYILNQNMIWFLIMEM